ncbi:MAG: PmbA/TldA family metallopeptidase, partial [Candidatus Acidiferrales bacterium]
MATRKKTRGRAGRSSAQAETGARLSPAELKNLAARILKLSAADETEVEISFATDALTRFANNVIHQNVAEQTLAISVRAVIDGRTARATTNRTDEDSLRRAVEAAITLARHTPKNPGLLPLLGPQKYKKVSRYYGSTAEAAPEDRARAVTRVCKMADRARQTAAGIFSSGSVHQILA